ncbi:MAG: hypothetical protein OHK0029_06000 [Armatimonadaceae bacterium]
MQKPLENLPALNITRFEEALTGWKPVIRDAKPGMDRIVIEWDVIQGPRCLVFPAGHRGQGVDLCDDGIKRTSDERWADFLEFRFVPMVEEKVKEAGLRPQVICVDLRPIQVQRQRRRLLEAAAHAKSGVAH